MSNITFDASACPRYATPPSFYVIATEAIPAQREILPGDHILIDPRQALSEGCLALVNGCLERWHGQSGTNGVAIEVGREL